MKKEPESSDEGDDDEIENLETRRLELQQKTKAKIGTNLAQVTG